jgi:phosphatidylglycerophosphatase A
LASAPGYSKFIATLFGIGYFPVAPGTAGTLAAAAVYLLIPGSFFVKFIPGFPVLIIITLLGVFITGKAEQVMSKDDGRIVLDEFAGFFFGVFFLPKNFVLLVFVFILFRVFDIFKPEPIFRLQKLRSGWGIMADDVMAGIYANICLQIVIRIFPELIKI